MAIAGEGFVVAPRPHGSSPWAEGPRLHPVAALAVALSAEGERRVHWLPVFLGAGVATYFAADRRAAVVARSRSQLLRPWRLRGRCAGLPLRARRRSAGVCRGGFRADPVRGMAGRHADARPPPRLGRADRAGDRHRPARQGLAGHHRARRAARACARGAAAPGARPHSSDQRSGAARRSHPDAREAVSAAGAGRAGRMGFAERAVFRRDRRGRL